MATNNHPLLTCNHLEYRINYNTLFQNLSFALNAGESLGVVGPNGCGKTSLLRIMGGLARPSQGQIFWKGDSVFNTTRDEKKSIFYLSSEPALYQDLSVFENLKFYCQSFSQAMVDLNAFQKSLHKVGLTGREHQIVRSLSTGQKRRVILLALTLVSPEIVLADEPSSGLDTNGLKLCLDIFTELQGEKKTTFALVSHEPVCVDWCQKKIFLPDYKKILQKNGNFF